MSPEAGSWDRSQRQWIAAGTAVAMHGILFAMVALVHYEAPARNSEHIRNPTGTETDRAIEIASARDFTLPTVEPFAPDRTPSDMDLPNLNASTARSPNPGDPIDDVTQALPTHFAAGLLETFPFTPAQGLATPSPRAIGDASRSLQTSVARYPARMDDETRRAILEQDRKSLEARQPAGPPAKTSLFGSETISGQSFVFVIDRSKSVAREFGDLLEQAEREISRALGTMEEYHRFQVIAYNDRCVYLKNRGLVPATEANRESLRGFLTNLAPFGGTNHLQALLAALALGPDTVVLFTDGSDPDLNDAELEIVRREARNVARIHCIQFTAQEEPPMGFMQKLAQDNGGTYHLVRVR